MLAWCRLLPAISVCFRYSKWPKSMNSSRYPELWRESKTKQNEKKLNVALCSSFSLHSIGDERKLCVMVQRLYGLLILCVFFVVLVYIVFHLLLLSCVDCTVYIEKYGTQIRTFVYRSAFILCFTFSLR